MMCKLQFASCIVLALQVSVSKGFYSLRNTISQYYWVQDVRMIPLDRSCRHLSVTINCCIVATARSSTRCTNIVNSCVGRSREPSALIFSHTDKQDLDQDTMIHQVDSVRVQRSTCRCCTAPHRSMISGTSLSLSKRHCA